MSQQAINTTLERYVEGYVSVSDYTMLFTKLMILAPYRSSYIIPCFLPLLNERERNEACVSDADSEVAPLFIECPSTGYEFISMLSVFLLTQLNEKWEILKDESNKPACLYKNCMKFLLKEINCIVTVSFSEKYIAIYLKCEDKSRTDFEIIAAVILQGLEKIRLLLNLHKSFTFSMSFQCNYGDQSSLHTDMYNQELGMLVCKKNQYLPNDFQKKWLKLGQLKVVLIITTSILTSFPSLPGPSKKGYLTVNNIVKHLSPMTDKWIEIAAQLNVPTSVVDSILVSRLQDDGASLRKVVVWWFKNTANPEWNVIDRILLDKENELLKKVCLSVV